VGWVRCSLARRRVLGYRMAGWIAELCPGVYIVKVTNWLGPMDHSISAADANRNFSRLLREVRDGRSYVVTAHGRPVARIVPCQPADLSREAARSALLRRLTRQTAVDIGSWTRESLYER